MQDFGAASISECSVVRSWLNKRWRHGAVAATCLTMHARLLVEIGTIEYMAGNTVLTCRS